MSKKIFYEGSDGAVGYVTDITNEDFYRYPRIELYDCLELDCFELVCDFAKLIGVEIDRDETDFRLANHIRDTVVELLEKEFGIPFPVHGETELERDIRIRDAKDALLKLEYQTQYKELCELAAERGDVCIYVDDENKHFVIDSGSSESLKVITERLGVSSADICNSPVCHKAYIAFKNPQQKSLDEQIAESQASLCDLKEYTLVLCKGEKNEEVVRAMLTLDEVATIKKDIAGELSTGFVIQTKDGQKIESGIIDEINECSSPVKASCIDKSIER